MSWGEIPSPDDLEDAALELQRVRDSSQASLKQKDDYKDEVALAAQKQQRRIAHMGPLSLQAGDTARSYVDGMRFKMGEEEMRKRYEREMKTRKVRQPIVIVDGGWRSESDATSVAYKSEEDREFGEVKAEEDRAFGTPKAREQMLFGIPRMEEDRKFEEDEQIKRERARAMAMPGDPTGYVDNLSTIRILELWRGKPMSELDDAVRKLTDMDPYAKAALGNVPELRTNAQRMEARRIMNSEWRFDMSYGDHDYALPQASGAKRPGLDATQAKLVDVITAIASRSVLSGRYLSTDSRNAVFGANPMEPFGGLFDAPTSTVKPPSAVRGLFANANWALGIHGYQKSMVDRLQAIVGSKDETWLGDQVNFFGSWLMPSSRDIMGEHRTPVDIELAPLRTMMGLRSNLGLAPKTTPMIAADGQVALVGVLDDSDPLYQRSLFIPNWDPIRARYVYEATRSVGQAYADSSRYGAAAHALGLLPEVEVGATYMNPRVTAGHYFNPYNQRVEQFGVTGVVDEKDGGGLTIRSRHEVELDHIVSLKYAWDHGFRDMYLSALGDPHRLARVQRFMIDFGQGTGPFADQRNFALTSKEQNQAKSDKGPDQWMPHGIALDSLQHAGNLFHVQQHMSVIRTLRAHQAAIDGALNPDFMPTSVAEERAIQRVLRGWDIGSNNAFGRSRDEALKFWMETMLIPDLSEDPYYLQARASALMTYATMAKYAATWRLSPYNQGYLLARKYLSPIFRRGWDKLTGEPPKQWPSQFSEFRSARVERGDLRSFMQEWSSQGTYREMTSMLTGEVIGGERRIVAPTFMESFRYARGHENPFSVPDLSATPSSGALRSTFDDFRLERIVSYLRSEQGRVFGDAVFKSFSPTTSGVQRASSFEEAYRAIVPSSLRARLEREAMDEFRKLHVQEQAIRRGRAPLDASPLLTDIYRSLTDRSDGAGFGRRVTRALGDIANDFGIKMGDYGFRAWLSGSPVGQTLVDRFVSSPTIIGIETVSSYVATLTKQETYVSPIMGKRSLLGHDPFALTRGLSAENLRLTLRSFQPLGGLARIEAMREADRAAAAAAASAVARAQREQSRALAALPGGSMRSALQRLDRLRDTYSSSVRISAEGEVVPLSRHGSIFDVAGNLERSDATASLIRSFEDATQDLEVRRRAARDARKAFGRMWGPGQLPPTLERALDAKGVERFMADLWLSNPHATMFAGRVAHAPASIIKGAGRVGTAFGVEALENLTIKRSTLTGGKRFVSRGFRYGGLGLSTFGAFENLARYDRATGLLEDAGGFAGLSEEQKTDVLSYAHRTPLDVFLDEGLSVATLDPIGVFASGINRIGSGIVRGQLEQDASYRSELIGGILRDDIPIATKYRHRADIKRMNDAGLYPGEGSDMMIGSTRDAYAMREAVQRAAARQVYRRVDDARTAKEASAAKKALNKTIQAARWLGGLDPTDDVSIATRELVKELRAKEPRAPRSLAAMPIFTSTPYRPGQNLETFSRDDSLRLRRVISSDASRVNPDAMADKRARGMMERISGEARLLLDPPAAGRDASFGGFLAAYENRAAGRELVEKRRAALRDSLVQVGKLSPWVAGGEHTPDPLQRFFRNAIFPLDSMERADLERDRLQAVQRLPRK